MPRKLLIFASQHLLVLICRCIIAVESSTASSITYYVTPLCPTPNSSFTVYPAVTSSTAECALTCLLHQATCTVFNFGSAGSANSTPLCVHSNLGEVLATWSDSTAGCVSQYRGDLRTAGPLSYWDFRRSQNMLSRENNKYANFTLMGGATLNSTDGLVFTGSSSDYAIIPSINLTVFSTWANITNSSQTSLFMRVRRTGDRSSVYFSLHSCADPSSASVYLFETADNRIGVAVHSPYLFNDSNYIQWLDAAPINFASSEWFTVGFNYYGGSELGFNLLVSGSTRTATAAQHPLISAPSPPLCVSLGRAAGNGTNNLIGAIRCLIVTQDKLTIETVNAALIGC